MILSEWLLIALVALCVLGPYDFLRLLRTAMSLLRRWRQVWSAGCFAVRQHLDQEDRARYQKHDEPPSAH